MYIISFQVYHRKPYRITKVFNTYEEAVKWLEDNVKYWSLDMIRTYDRAADTE